MLKLARRKDRPHWWITGTLKGIRIRESTGTDSRAHAETILAQRTTQILDRAVYGERETATFAEAAELYLTQGGEARYLRPLLDRWKNMRLAAITPSEVARFTRERYGHLKPSSLNRQLHTPLNAVFNVAHGAGMCARTTFKRPKAERRPAKQYATDDWLVRLLPFCNARCAACVLFMTLTGARVSEACNLVWGDVDAGRKRALLRMTKGGEPREVALAPAVIKALTAIAGERKADQAVFGYASRFSARQAIERAIRRHDRHAEKNGLEPLPPLSAHQIGRHGFAARLLKQGHSLKVVQEAGGWASIAIVAQHYGHLERSAVDAAVTGAGTNLTPALTPKKKARGKRNA